ncbi:hypothetical protein OXX80_003248, partial [Metschnikowia pulcherrima]
MSFFGFDTSGPQKQAGADAKVYDFQETYEGLGDYEQDDMKNSETFGVSEVGKNFDFSRSTGGQGHVSAAQTRPNVSFARAAAANDDEFMKDLWGDNTPEPAAQNAAGAAQSAPKEAQPVPAPSDERKVLSLQEIEA